MKEGLLSPFTKRTSIIFNRSILKEHHDIIKTEMQNLLSTTKEESDLIKEDNLARSSIVNTTQVVARLSKHEKDNNKKYWAIDTRGLKCLFKDNPHESWGDIDLY